jgi:hypothetical protein
VALMEQFLELRNQVNKEADRCFDACFNKI